MFRKEIGVDLGTVNVLVHVRGRGIVLQEPSVVALSVDEDKIVAVGEEARAMLGRTPDLIDVVRPMRDGVIADYRVTEAMLRYFIQKVTGFRLFKPRIMISVPYGVTSVESRAVHEAGVAAGGSPRDVHLIPEPIAAALGAGLPVETPTGNMIVDFGAGTTAAAAVPPPVRIPSSEVTEAIQEPLGAIIGVIRSVLEKTPPELSSDIIDRGMVLVGGGALLRKIAAL